MKKCQALKDLEKGMSNKVTTAKYGVPKNTINLGQKQRKTFRFTRKR